MKAVIMAGGEGTRLRPLTGQLPKPMAPLCGKPVLCHLLDLLGRHGIERAVITVKYLANQITEYFAQNYGSHYGPVDLDFVVEERFLGTAGSVRGAAWQEKEDLLILSGDALCDFDLTAAIRYHRERGAFATLLTRRVEDPREYGLVDVDDQGMVRGFIEKPGYPQAVTDLANTGIYLMSPRLLELVPDGQPFDFARDLFPLMLSQGMPIHAYEAGGYWCDIGDPAAYHRCQMDMLDGKVDCRIEGTRSAEGVIFAGEPPRGRYTILPPAYIGRNVRIGEGSLLSRAVVENHVVIGSSCRVWESVLLPHSVLDDREGLTGSILLRTGREGPSIVCPAVRPKGGWRPVFDEEGLCGRTGQEVTPEVCARIGSAVGMSCPGKLVGVGHAADEASAAFSEALIAGLLASGAEVLDFGGGFLTLFRHQMSRSGAGVGLFLEVGTDTTVRLCAEGGLPAGRPLERAIERRLSEGAAVTDPGRFGRRTDLSGLARLYERTLCRLAGGRVTLPLSVQSDDPQITRLFERVASALGCTLDGELRLLFSKGGRRFSLVDPQIGPLSDERLFLLCARLALRSGGRLAVPCDASPRLESLAEEMGGELLRYHACPADESDRQARGTALASPWVRDGVMRAAMLLGALGEGHTLAELLRPVPRMASVVRMIPCKGSPGRLLGQLALDRAPEGEGLMVCRQEGLVRLRPTRRGDRIRIEAEAASSELADELCGSLEAMLHAAETPRSDRAST